MLQNARVTAFTVSELLREREQGGGWRWGGVKLPPARLGLRPKKTYDIKNLQSILYV